MADLNSSITWLDFSEDDRRKMNEAGSVLKMRWPRGEPGRSLMLNAFAGAIFPRADESAAGSAARLPIHALELAAVWGIGGSFRTSLNGPNARRDLYDINQPCCAELC